MRQFSRISKLSDSDFFKIARGKLSQRKERRI
jgi:hypothetical protein